MALNEKHRELKEYPFDSARKRMSSVREYNGKHYLFVKGSPESVIAQCTKLWDHSFTRSFTAHDRKRLLAYHEEHAGKAQRNIAIAYRELPASFNPKQHTLDDEPTENFQQLELTNIFLQKFFDIENFGCCLSPEARNNFV